MSDYSGLLQSSAGGTSFQLEDYDASYEAVLKDGYGRVGTRILINGKGWVQGTSAADFGSKLAATADGFKVDGADFFVYGLGGQLELKLPAAQCRDGGPFASFKVLRQSSGVMLKKDFEFTLVAESGSFNLFKDRTAWRPNDLRTITRSGEIVGPDAMQSFLANALPAAVALWSWPDWVVSHEVDNNSANDRLIYTITAVELDSPRPGSADDMAVDGTQAERRERDEQQRQVVTISYDLLIKGDPETIINMIRPEGTITRESVEVTGLNEIRVRAAFNFLYSGSGDELLNWDQTFEGMADPAGGAVIPIGAAEYPHGAPILYYGTILAYRYTQRGSAIGLGKFPKPPEPLFPDRLAGEPKVTQTHLNLYEKQTAWEYAFVLTEAHDLTDAERVKLDRPTAPAFYGPTPPPAGGN